MIVKDIYETVYEILFAKNMKKASFVLYLVGRIKKYASPKLIKCALFYYISKHFLKGGSHGNYQVNNGIQYLKGHWKSITSSPNFLIKVEFVYIIIMANDCILSLRF